MSRTIVARVLQALVLVGLVAGTTAWVALEKTVTISVDGQAREIRTYSSTVGSVLARAGLVAGPHDTLAPSASTKIHDGSTIVLRRGRLLALSIDGHPRKVWVTALSVDEALAQLGVRNQGAYLSASRSRSIGLDGFSLSVRLPHRVEIVADGRVRRVTTTAPTVARVLADQHIRLWKTDRLNVPARAYPTQGLQIRVTRVRGGRLVESTSIGYATIRHADPTMYVGHTRYTVYGLEGVRVSVYATTYVNGHRTAKRLLSSKVTAKPRDAVLYYGTKPLPWRESCSASWYYPSGYGAAHRTLPFGTKVKVVNVDTGASVIVTINDRGPYVAGRCIDLDRDAFAAIANLGSGTVHVRLYY